MSGGIVRARWAVLPAAVLVGLAGAPAAYLAGGSGGATAARNCAPAGPPAAGTVEPGDVDAARLGPEERGHAATIVRVGQGMRLPARGLVVALATALQESRLRNLTYGDRDSVGLFQQRPSQGWGTVAQIMDPQYAARKFYERLLAVPGWEAMPITVAAQEVQRSAFPNAYAQWEPLAVELAGSAEPAPAAAPCVSPVGYTGGDTSNAGPDGVLPHVAFAAAEIRSVFGFTGTIGGWGTRPNPTEHDDGLAIDVMLPVSPAGDSIAGYFVANRARLRVTYVIWNYQVESGDSRGWHRYTGPNPHTDHVHVSFAP